jgi:hypothetical protein
MFTSTLHRRVKRGSRLHDSALLGDWLLFHGK